MRPEKILLVDDNELLLSGMQRSFQKDFAHVKTSRTGEEALLSAGQHSYDVVILDINLPGISGWEVLKSMRQLSSGTKVIIITSGEYSGIRHDALSRGAVECMGKPFDLDELKYVVINVISRGRHHRMGKTFPVRFGGSSRGVVFNLSATGMFILTDIFCERGAMLDITLENEQEEIRLKGQVVRTVDSAIKNADAAIHYSDLSEKLRYGVGIKIVEHPPVYSDLINSLL